MVNDNVGKVCDGDDGGDDEDGGSGDGSDFLPRVGWMAGCLLGI